MFIVLILFILGFIFLIKGADFLVEGASSLAVRYEIPSLVIGLTIVAFGTSAPELFVNILASIKGNSEVVLGNIIGSNIANTLLILGIASVITPLVVKKNTTNQEIPFSLLAIVIVGFLANDFLFGKNLPSFLSRRDGFILISFFGIFLYYIFSVTFGKQSFFGKIIEETTGKTPLKYGIYKSILMIILGLIGLSLGGKWIVEGAVYFAKIFNVSEALISLTILSVGTSLPELTTSAVAAYKGKKDIAIGNVVGSNIFNIFWVLGLSAIIRPIAFPLFLNVDLAILLVITILTIFLIFWGKKNVLGRSEGIIFLSLYASYIVFLVLRG